MDGGKRHKNEKAKTLIIVFHSKEMWSIICQKCAIQESVRDCVKVFDRLSLDSSKQNLQ